MDDFLDTLPALLSAHARLRTDDRAFAFLSGDNEEAALLTYGELNAQVDVVAYRLMSRHREARRALLVFSPGLEFIIAFLACLRCGVTAVPTVMPRRGRLRDASLAILRSAEPELIMTRSDSMPLIRALYEQESTGGTLSFCSVDIVVNPDSERKNFPKPANTTDVVAFLQYTSGSTSDPKGVAISHRNVDANLWMISAGYQLSSASTRVGWIPHYHDMGLIFNILQTIYCGAFCVLMAPAAFVQHPWNWLRAISKYQAELVMAPNSAYALCCRYYRDEHMRDVDLSRLRIAVNGAEPIWNETQNEFAETFEKYGFCRDAFFPSYGMAEATLGISGAREGKRSKCIRVSKSGLKRHVLKSPADASDEFVLISSGQVFEGVTVAIVDPVKRTQLGCNDVGEVWVRGANVSAGYWRNSVDTDLTFRAEIVSAPGEKWLRTGDLGCFDEERYLYISGRLKDVINIRGENHYPQDIELSAQKSHPALNACIGAAFVQSDGDERLIIIQEVRRHFWLGCEKTPIIQAVKRDVVHHHGISPFAVILVRSGSLAKTTSGKIRRRYIKELWRSGAFEPQKDAELEA